MTINVAEISFDDVKNTINPKRFLINFENLIV